MRPDDIQRSEPVKPGEFYKRLDIILADRKKARRLGERSDLGVYDERFQGIELSWIPTQPQGPDGPHDITGAPHVIDIRVNRTVAASSTPIVATSRPVQDSVEGLWTSGQRIGSLNSQ